MDPKELDALLKLFTGQAPMSTAMSPPNMGEAQPKLAPQPGIAPQGMPQMGLGVNSSDLPTPEISGQLGGLGGLFAKGMFQKYPGGMSPLMGGQVGIRKTF